MRRSLWVGLGLLAALVAHPSLNAAPEPHVILRLHRGQVDARQPAATGRQELASADSALQIVQFQGPITAVDREALERTGAVILEYLPDFAYLVRATSAQVTAAGALPNVYAISRFTLADKLAPAVLSTIDGGTTSSGAYRVYGWDNQGVTRQLDRRQLLQTAASPEVRWIEPDGSPRLLNDVAASIMHVPEARASNGLYGAGQTIGVADSGLDTGDPTTISADFTGRVVSTHVLSPTGDLADTNGHGTHVAGSIAGSGALSGAKPAEHAYSGSFAGIAPEANLVVQAFEADDAGQIYGLDDDYYTLFQQAYDDGARLHSDSWGDATGPAADTEKTFGGYPFGAQRTDAFIWDHPDMAVFLAAGNSGTDGAPTSFGLCTGSDGVVDEDSLLSPGTAKNVITVGASENLRASGGLSEAPWFLLNLCFFASPIFTDTLSNNPDGMAAFSSRGPTDDGRMKPDIVAPGTNIVSSRSHAPGAGTLWGVSETNADYVYSGGTSMATPLVAGAGALAREWLVREGAANPSAALVKALLLNTTQNMAPGQYGEGPTQEIPNARPNAVAGWGRADLGFVGAPEPYHLWTDDHTAGLSTAESITYAGTPARPLRAIDSGQPLRIMLTWTDPPASLSAAAQLVNDLDLIVRGPNGETYFGNGAVDRVNNVEGVIIDAPPLGDYTIEVRGYNVPMSKQPYALVVSGALSSQVPGEGPATTKHRISIPMAER